MRRNKRWVLGLGLVGLLAFTGTAQAVPIFEGRLADNTASTDCTALDTGGTTKCTSFYFTTLDITILNNWNIGRGVWDDAAAEGSAQAIAASAGKDATGLDGWVLPTGDGDQAAGPLNQYLSIWNAVGGSLANLQGQFDGVRSDDYWSGTEFAPNPGRAWLFSTDFGDQFFDVKFLALYAVAVRPGDVTAAVPEPGTLGLMLAALGAGAVVRRRRSR